MIPITFVYDSLEIQPLLHEVDNLAHQLIAGTYPIAVGQAAVNLGIWTEAAATSAIEGNRTSATDIIAEQRPGPAGNFPRPLQEALNGVNAIAYIYATCQPRPSSKSPLDHETLQDLHTIIMHKSTLAFEKIGVWRFNDADVVGPNEEVIHTGERPENIDLAMQSWSRAYAPETHEHPLVRSALAHLGLTTIHPWADGNGRTSRAVMTAMLIEDEYPPLSFSRVLQQNRSEYFEELQKPHVTGEATSYLKFILKTAASSSQIQLDNLASLNSVYHRIADKALETLRDNTAADRIAGAFTRYPILSPKRLRSLTQLEAQEIEAASANLIKAGIILPHAASGTLHVPAVLDLAAKPSNLLSSTKILARLIDQASNGTSQ